MKWVRYIYVSSPLGTNILVTTPRLFLPLFHGSSSLSCFVCIASVRTGLGNISVRLTWTSLAGGFPELGAEGDTRALK